MSVQYKASSVTVSRNINQDVMVYSHPGDRVSFDFDISALDKEIINGNLVIHLLNGKTVTLVNFGLMVLDNKSPEIEDANRTYNPFSLFDGQAYYEQDIGRYVISRVISSPDKLSALDGNELPSSKEIADGEGVFSKQVGNFLTPEQSLIPEFAPLIQDYVSKTFQHPYTKLYESDINFTSNNQFIYNEVNSDIFPVKLLIINPRITPEYGTDYRYEVSKNENHKGYNDLFVDIGGGRLRGDEYAYLMYTPATIDLSKEQDTFWFDGPSQTNKIIRFFHIGVPAQSVLFTKVLISGLPSGISVISRANSNLEVKPLGSGTYEITVRGNAAGGVEIPIEYAIGIGGDNGVFAPVGISYEGVQAKSGDLIRGNNTVYFEFKPVHGPGDISNFNKYNTYTYSTLRDPLIIRFGSGNDVIKGGEGDYTYYGTAGNNKATGGSATEVFHLGSGENEFYAGLGNDTVDVDDPNKDNSLYLSDALEAADANSVTTTIDNGSVVFTGKNKGIVFKSTMKNFANVYFDIGDNGKVINRNDVVTINSTWGIANNIVLHMGEGNNTVKAGNNAILIDFKPWSNGSNLIFITTHETAMGAFVAWGNGDNKIIGSSIGDVIRGYNNNESLTYYSNGGESTADYNAVTTNLTYDASSGLVVKEGMTSLDKISGVQKFIGGTAENIFYGAVYYTSFDGTQKEANMSFYGNGREGQNKLSYEKLSSVTAEDKKHNGVKIDLSNNTVTKLKTGGIDRLFNIDSIEASNNNDIFIVSSDIKSSSLNGLGGFNTIDYSKSVVQVDFNIAEQGRGTVTKGGGSHGIDIINNFRHFIGSTVGSTFSLNDYNFNDKENPYRYIIEGKSNVIFNRINYSEVSGKALVVDMKLGEATIVTMYTGKNAQTSILGKDQLINVGVFGLTNDANNIIYMYASEQLNYIIDGGANSNCLISFEKASSAISLNFNSNNYSNLNGITYLKLSENNDKVIMGSGFFAQEIDGNKGINEIDFSNLVLPIITSVNLDNIELKEVNIGSKNIKVRNFNRIVATSSDDVFNIEFDLNNINNIKDKKIYFDGSQGVNTINFLGVHNSVNSSEGLIVDISEGIVFKVTDSKHNSVLNFIDFHHIVGSKGDDTFILPVFAFDFTIDGGLGTNTVSYQAYTQGIHITEDILSKFKNIQKIIGSQGNDIISLTESTSLVVDGYAGFNSASYVGEINSVVNVDITEKILNIVKGSKTDILSHIEFIDFYSSNVANGVNFNIKTKSNNNITSGGSLFLSGSKPVNGVNKDKIVYKSLDSGVTLNLNVEGNLPARGHWINVDKGNNSIDYLQNISHILLSNNSQVNVYNSIGALDELSKMEIDGGGSGNLSFAKYNGAVIIDVTVATMKFSSTLEITFTGFNTFEGSGGANFNSTFISSGDKDYIFDGLLSRSKLSYEKVTGDLNVTISGANNKGYNYLELKKSSNTDKAYNIVELRGSKGNTNVMLESEVNNDMLFESEAESKSKISYEKINNAGVLIFAINKDGVHVGRANGLYNDRILNFTDIVGSKGNSRFEVDTSILQSNTLYSLDGGGGNNTINFGNFDANISFRMEANSPLIKVNLGQKDFGTISNMNIIFGTSTKTNTFVLGNFFNQDADSNSKKSVTIYGNSNNNSQDVLDLKDTQKNLSLDPLTGIINISNSNNILLTALTGIHTINLGNGDHQVDISSGISAVGWKTINGGTGQNNVSFSKILSGIVYDLSLGIKNLGFQLVNFSGVTGSRGNDTFELKAINENTKGIRIDGFGGTLNTLDFSDLNVMVNVDIASKKVTRGNITDTVTNIQIFKSGKGGGEFKSFAEGNYQFLGNVNVVSKNVVSYAGVELDLIFNFNTKSIVKGSSNYDSFEGISKFVGGNKKNTFIFSTDNMKGNYSEITLDGATGVNNIVNLAQLSSGITFIIDSKFFTVKYNNSDLKVKLENIHQVIGTRHADTFIFGNNTNKFNANGGITDPGIKNTADFSDVSSSVIVDFSNRSIVYSNNQNSFANIDRFIGSKVGGNIFKGLTTNTSYDIDGGSDGNMLGGNTVQYSGASTGLKLSVKDGRLNIDKSGDLFDTFKNIHNIILSDLADELVFNSISDLDVYKMFKKIDGGLGDNLVIFSESVANNSIRIDIDAGNISIGNNTQSIKLLGFNSWKFANSNANHTIIAATGNFNFRLIEFGANNKSTVDLTKISENLTISILEDGVTANVVGTNSGNRGNFVNLKNLLLGSKNYNLSFIQFNPNASGNLNIKADASSNMSLSISKYIGNNANIKFNGRDVQLDAARFTNLNNLYIDNAAQNTAISIGKLTSPNINFYLNNSSIENGRANINFSLETSKSSDANIIFNSNNFIIKQNNNTFFGTIVTNGGKIKIDTPVALQINTLKPFFKELESLATSSDTSDSGIIDFTSMPYSSIGIEYNISIERDKIFHMGVKETNNSKDNFSIDFRNNRTIVGSTNSDHFIIDITFINNINLKIIENGPLSNINTLTLNFQPDSTPSSYSISLSNKGIYWGNRNISFGGNRGINSIIFTERNSNFLGDLSATVSPQISHIKLPANNVMKDNFFTSVYLDKEYSSFPLQMNMNFSSPVTATVNLFYSSGKLLFENFHFGTGNNPNISAGSINRFLINVGGSNPIIAKDDYFVLSSEHMFKNGTRFHIGYAPDNDIERTFMQNVNTTLDLRDFKILGTGFRVVATDVLTTIDFKLQNVVIAGKYFKNVYLNRTIADKNSDDAKAIMEFDSTSLIENSKSNSDYKFSFGTLSEMQLPKYYRILSPFLQGPDFPGSSQYPAWTNGLNNGINNPLKYDTYNNIVSFKAGSGGVYADLLMNNNNESFITNIVNGQKSSKGVYVSAANMFWLTSSSTSAGGASKIYIHEISRAKPFALMLNENNNNVIDFSNVRDGQTYVFRYIYNVFVRDNQSLVTITNLPSTPGTIPLDDSMKIYGNFAGAKYLILTSAKNVIYANGGLTDKNVKHIDGGAGISTLSFTTNLSGYHGINFAKGENKGFKLFNGPNGTLTDILYTNVKIIEPGYRNNFQGFKIVISSEQKFNSNFEHNFIIRQPDIPAKNRKETVLTDVSKAFNIYQLNIFMNNKYFLFSDDRTVTGNNFSILSEDFAINKIEADTISFVMGLQINFEKIRHYNGYEINITATREFRLYLPDGGNNNLNYTYNVNSSSGIISFRPSDPTVDGADTSLILKVQTGYFDIIYPSNRSLKFKQIDSDDIEETFDTLPTYNYYEYIAAHSLYQLTEGDNAYKKSQDIDSMLASSNNVVMGANIWVNQYEYEKSLTNSVVNENYWKDLDTRINNAFLVDNKKNMNEKLSNINHDEDENIKDFDSDQNEFTQNYYEEYEFNNHHSDIEIDEEYNNADNNDVEDELEDDSINSDDLTDNDNIDYSNVSNSSNNEAFDLNSILEAAKNITEIDANSNQSTILDNFSIDSIPTEVIENTYLQDEANSMSYTIDTSNAAMSSFHSGIDQVSESSSVQEQQKNKLSY